MPAQYFLRGSGIFVSRLRSTATSPSTVKPARLAFTSKFEQCQRFGTASERLGRLPERDSGLPIYSDLRQKGRTSIMRLQTIVSDSPIQLDRQTDQRQEQRRQLRQSATVSLLGTTSEILSCEIRNISKGGIQIWIEHPLQYASLLAIDSNDNRLLGEVIYCQEEQGGWLVGIRIEHALFGLTALASMEGRY